MLRLPRKPRSAFKSVYLSLFPLLQVKVKKKKKKKKKTIIIIVIIINLHLVDLAYFV
jgi:hypothetical protein